MSDSKRIAQEFMEYIFTATGFVSSQSGQLEEKLAGMVDALISEKYGVTLGVGSGAGALFVHGNHDSIVAARAFIRECESLKARLDEALRERERGELERAKLVARVYSLTSERDRYKTALERIANQGTHAPDWKHWSDIAREALAPNECKHEPYMERNLPYCRACGARLDSEQWGPNGKTPPGREEST
jgi:hypothetical protein